ncbi:beta-mannosidase-like [Condylostylus longicornis]|uniref:beta-mannosidase-like n=1 Tax=Condylostylus longicornis TaxID=2530218 RepID=UPI00244E16DB|nr:beta-mannosidase-like [Condylostylus longicornis]
MYNYDNFNDLLEHRQHLPFGNEIRSCLMFRQLPLITSDQPDYAENITCLRQLTQALATKLETEILRKNRNSKHNRMGALYCQLNDVWIAPSWSSIDFNGNYKFLHYWAKEFMKPISIIAHSNKSTNDVEITVIRDTIEKSPLTFNIIRNTFLYNTLAPTKIYAAKTISIKPNSVLSADTFQLESNLDPKTYFYEILLKDGRGNILDSTPFNTIDQIGIVSKNNLWNSFTDVRFSITIGKSIRTETVQNIKRIAHHASIAIIAGNNENEAALVQNWYNTKPEQKRFEKEHRLLYNATINDKLRKFYKHPSRPDPLTSSPSNCDTIEDDFISPQPQDPNYGDIHFYKYFRDWSDPDVYPIPRFSSEYGFQSLPQKSAWDKIMYNHDNFNDLLEHRQHLPFGNEIRSCLIFRQLPLITSDQPDYAENIIYFSQLTQALATKLETEILRKNRNSKHNTMGALYCQLNDVWIAPSWSSINFNGNYKILHYWAKEFMKPISIIAHSNKSTNDVEITVIRDSCYKI